MPTVKTQQLKYVNDSGRLWEQVLWKTVAGPSIVCENYSFLSQESTSLFTHGTYKGGPWLIYIKEDIYMSKENNPLKGF